MKFATFLSSVLASAALVACGGGGSGTPAATATADTADKYVGTWTLCNPISPNDPRSAKDTVTFTKTSAATGSFVGHYDYYIGKNCAGTPSELNTITGTFSIVGTNVIDAKTVDLINLSVSAPVVQNQKSLAYINANTLLFGTYASPVDENGYPTTLSTRTPYIKQ